MFVDTISAPLTTRGAPSLGLSNNRSDLTVSVAPLYVPKTFAVLPQSYHPSVCSWVRSQEALRLVSGDCGDCLTPEILRSWLASAHKCVAMLEHSTQSIVGFCTLSVKENSLLPSRHVEICHVVIDQSLRHTSVCAKLVRAARAQAYDDQFDAVCGRIVPSNEYMLAIARRVNFASVSESTGWALPGFRWFIYDLVCPMTDART